MNTAALLQFRVLVQGGVHRGLQVIFVGMSAQGTAREPDSPDRRRTRRVVLRSLPPPAGPHSVDPRSDIAHRRRGHGQQARGPPNHSRLTARTSTPGVHSRLPPDAPLLGADRHGPDHEPGHRHRGVKAYSYDNGGLVLAAKRVLEPGLLEARFAHHRAHVLSDEAVELRGRTEEATCHARHRMAHHAHGKCDTHVRTSAGPYRSAEFPCCSGCRSAAGLWSCLGPRPRWAR